MTIETYEREDAATENGAERESSDDYNFAHFRFRHVLADVKGTIRARGIRPGDEAPDFVLPRTNGGSLRLSALRGCPVLLHFGSFT